MDIRQLIDKIQKEYNCSLSVTSDLSSVDSFAPMTIKVHCEGKEATAQIPHFESLGDFEFAVRSLCKSVSTSYGRQTKEFIIKKLRDIITDVTQLPYGSDIVLDKETLDYFLDSLYARGLRPTERINYSKYRLTHYISDGQLIATVNADTSTKDLIERLASLEDELEAGLLRRIILPTTKEEK